MKTSLRVVLWHDERLNIFQQNTGFYDEPHQLCFRLLVGYSCSLLFTCLMLLIHDMIMELIVVEWELENLYVYALNLFSFSRQTHH